jgi:dihydroxyacetone kinase DhaKLM complex PTS-EIIA-like component DhaM
MNKDNINISKIETYLHGIIDGKVSANTYVGTLPDTIQSSWNDMCLIDIGSAIRDMNAYGRGAVNIFLYARPLLNGSKNVALLSSMEQKLNEVIKTADNPLYQINRLNTYTDYDTERKWHCNIIALNILIY